MNILILHRIPYHKIDYHRGIDHVVHEVTYIGIQEALANIPPELPCIKITRAGLQSVEEEVIAWVQKTNKKFDRIVSLSEYELLAAAKIRETLKISGASVTDVNKVRDKVIMKEHVEKAGIAVPQFQNLTHLIENKMAVYQWKGPTVLKPIDGASSENVKVFPSLLAILQKTIGRKTGIALIDKNEVSLNGFQVEEFIQGPILHIDGLVHRGKIKICVASQYIGNCLDYAHGAPLASIQIDTTPEIKHWAQRCLSAVNIQQGCFHLEAISTEEGLVFLEIANRAGGADVVKTFELATGIHLPSAELSILVDNDYKKAPLLKPFNPQHFGWFVFPGHHIDTDYCHIQGTEGLKNNPHIRELYQLAANTPCTKNITYQPTEVPLAGVVQAANSAELETFVQDVFSAVSVTRWK